MSYDNRSITIQENKIYITFPFDLSIIEKVRTIEGRLWDKDLKVWTVPATPYHYQQVLNVLGKSGFDIDPTIKKLADPKALPKKMEYPEGLYDFQREGVDFLYKTNGRAILADEMGLGKTITTLAYIKMFIPDRVLIICPASVVWKWAAEWEKWVGGERKVQVIRTGKDEIDLEASAIILSYTMATNKLTDILLSGRFALVVCDEAHALKSYKAKRTAAVKEMVAGTRMIFLSGTPFLNHPTELFTLLNMIDGIGFKNFFQFAKRYCGAQYMDRRWFIPKDTVTNRDELAQRLSMYMIRRTKKDVSLQLPEITRVYVPVEIDNMPEYKSALKEARSYFKGWHAPLANALVVLGRLRQAVGNGKVSSAVEMAENILEADQKVVLFAHHKEVVKELSSKLNSYGVAVISGDVPNQQRQVLVDAFQNNIAPRVMIITIAGSEGIDLFAASNIIFVEREWTPAKEEQAEARLHRMGQKNNVTAWYLVARGTVDDKLNSIVQRKRNLFGQVISQDYVIEKLMEDL